jgi:heterodisulfide reductase subunit C
MIEFGYSIQADRQIDYDLHQKRILEFVRQSEPSIDWCMSCGTCASACTAAELTNFSLRKLILLARRGIENDLISMVHRCRFCGKCFNACPRSVNTRNIVYLMQLAATKLSKHEATASANI